ncbi:response regulator [Devosia sp. XJ19-1]|uniref:Response regulator n=1 Tax=Devosia ureilytica TaxID=2952754 RepID=A0A9Q4ANA8_9HYPH|nr:HD domain-containing phosphohydrolase [Devosia ureilytica]MCP8883736.1 response regulator [Devosia ureilytica]MCP8887344.1 response regulator [Devosia ureilytica]
MRVVIAEDNSTNLAVLCGIVGKMDGVTCQGYAEPGEALAYLMTGPCDLAIVDFLMPGMNGVELIQAMRALPQHQHVPIIMITADADRSLRLDAICKGATDFLAKPVDPIELRSRVANLLALRAAQNELASRAKSLAEEVALATAHLQRREEEIVYRLARAIEFRDNETSEHVGRVAAVSRLIAQEMQQDEAFVRVLYLAAPLHDVGKIGVPDAILNKPGKLDPAERELMQTHAAIGADILANGDSDLVRMAAAVAAGHHERWDGKGYPLGLSGANIPLAARITAVADVFDALCSERSYKPAWPIECAREEIQRSAGSHFDPGCVAAFDRAWPRIEALYASPLTSAA